MRLSSLPVRLFLAFLSAYPFLTAGAQFTIAKVSFRNPGSFAQAGLEQTAGLHSGEATTRMGIQKAAQNLMDTGYFDDVGVDSKGAPNAMEIIFLLKPELAGKETATGFENFVWFTSAELEATVHKAAPLFHGRLPEAGNQADLLEAALQAALGAKGVNRKVSHETLEPSTSQPIRAVEFRAEPSVPVGEITLHGVPAQLSTAQGKVVQRLSGSAFNEGLAGETTTEALLQPSLDAGYLEARLTGLQRTVTPAGKVDLSATLEPGSEFHVAAMDFGGLADAPGITPGAALAAAKLHPGDVASRQQLLLSMQPIDDAYKKHGYLDVYVHQGEVLDSSAHTVSYHFTVTPGEVYHLHSVTPIGLSPAAQIDFNRAWRMKPGDVYNADYVSHFIENNSALRALAMYSATFRASADPATRLVDLTMTFAQAGVPMRR